jgi:hypothetical protein
MFSVLAWAAKPFGRDSRFQPFAAVVSLTSGKDGTGHSERVEIEDFSAAPHVGPEP